MYVNFRVVETGFVDERVSHRATTAVNVIGMILNAVPDYSIEAVFSSYGQRGKCFSSTLSLASLTSAHSRIFLCIALKRVNLILAIPLPAAPGHDGG